MGTAIARPFAQAMMLIRAPAHDVYEAFVDPAITTKFWFTDSTGRLDAGQPVRWTWAMYGVSTPVTVTELEPDQLLVFTWGDEPTTVSIRLLGVPNKGTFVKIAESGGAAEGEALLKLSIDRTGGWNLVLAALKAYLEHNVILRVVEDHLPAEVRA